MTLLPQLRNINYLSSVHTTCMPRDCLIDFLNFFSLFIGCKKKKKLFHVEYRNRVFVFTTAVLCDQVFFVLCFLDYNRSYR